MNGSNNVPIIGQNKIVLSITPGIITGTFNVQIDTSNFQYGVPLAVQVLLQATMMLVPEAYQTLTQMRNSQ